MTDWIGLIFFVLIVIGVIGGLKLLAKPRKSTGEEFERNVSLSTSMLGGSINALNEILDPSAVRSKEVQTQLKEGIYNKKSREAKPEEDEHLEK